MWRTVRGKLRGGRSAGKGVQSAQPGGIGTSRQGGMQGATLGTRNTYIWDHAKQRQQCSFVRAFTSPQAVPK
jgi:hypothetical protein